MPVWFWVGGFFATGVCQVASFSLSRKAMHGILTSIKSFGESLTV